MQKKIDGLKRSIERLREEKEELLRIQSWRLMIPQTLSEPHSKPDRIDDRRDNPRQ